MTRASCIASPSATAHTSQSCCVMITSGCSARSTAASMPITERPAATACCTARWISADDWRPSIGVTVTLGSDVTDSGQSHSWETPTSCAMPPIAATISVAPGRSETISFLATMLLPRKSNVALAFFLLFAVLSVFVARGFTKSWDTQTVHTFAEWRRPPTTRVDAGVLRPRQLALRDSAGARHRRPAVALETRRRGAPLPVRRGVRRGASTHSQNCRFTVRDPRSWPT